MIDRISPNRQALEEALRLSEELLKNIELGEIPLTQITLRACRLARLLNEFDTQQMFEYEASGYPTESNVVPPEPWRLALAAGRRFLIQDPKTKEPREYVYTESIGELEEALRVAEASLAAAQDRDVSVSSANPQQFVWSPIGNAFERLTIRQSIAQTAKRIASRRALLHRYALIKHYELKFSGIAADAFSRIRDRVTSRIGATVPEAVRRFAAIHENLVSDNPEDWSNAVHSCRRTLLDLADAVYPARESDRMDVVNGKERRIRLGKEQYINRIICFVEERSSSTRFQQVVGSHLSFLGDRLDSIAQSASKGTHTTIVSREEADRYVVYTYMLIGDVLTLVD